MPPPKGQNYDPEGRPCTWPGAWPHPSRAAGRAVETLSLFELGHGSEVVPQALPKPFVPIRVESVIEESWQILCLHKEGRISGDEVVRGLLVPAGGAAAFGPGMDTVNVLADDFGTEMIVVLDQPPKRAMREDEYGRLRGRDRLLALAGCSAGKTSEALTG